MPFSGTFSFEPYPVTGNPMFDWFFWAVIIFGAISFGLEMLFSMFRRR